MKQILIKFTDGRLGYCRPNGPMLDGESEQDYLTRVGQETISKCIRDKQPGWAGATVVAHVEPEVIHAADRSFRDGWDWTTPEPVMDYNMPKCREIAAKRSSIPVSDSRISNAKTLEELKSILPEVLK